MRGNWKWYLLLFCLLTSLMTFTSCAFQYDIISDKETDINFKKYRTFDIIHDDHGFEKGANPINKQRIDRAVEKEFQEIGYFYSENPDLQIYWFIIVDTELEAGIYNAYYSRWRYPRAVDVYEYQVGSLVIDIIDTRSGQVVWHAKASGRVDEGMPDVEDKINQVVKEIFTNYKRDTGINKIKAYAFK